jgi:hypothetical protein
LVKHSRPSGCRSASRTRASSTGPLRRHG